MGITCQIHLNKPPDWLYHPGENISGVIKYSVNNPMEIEKVVTSLKGTGRLHLTVSRGTYLERTYKTRESFIKENTDIHAEKLLLVGSHEFNFNFVLPEYVPSTLKLTKSLKFQTYKVKCFIKYYIRVLFERPGLFTFNKKIKKEITVISTLAPTLPREPTVYTENKKLLRLFSNQDSLITINATVLNSVLPMEGKIELRIGVQNNSHVVVKTTRTKLIQQYIFKSKGYRRVNYAEAVPDTEAQTVPINSQESQNRLISIDIPPDVYCLRNAYIVSRIYAVRIIAQLPIPYKNVVLDVPVEIGSFENHAEGSTEVKREGKIIINNEYETTDDSREENLDDDSDTAKFLGSELDF